MLYAEPDGARPVLCYQWQERDITINQDSAILCVISNLYSHRMQQQQRNTKQQNSPGKMRLLLVIVLLLVVKN